MNLFQIALRNLNRRKSKMLFMLLGLVLGSATVVTIYSTVTAMQKEISQQLAELGANIVISADSGELTFQYGGITIPELVFDAATLTEADLDALITIPASSALLAVAPKLIGTVAAGENSLVIAGADLPAEFAVKPWLRFHEEHGNPPLENQENGSIANNENEAMEMVYELLNLERVTDVPEIGPGQVVLGSAIAALMELKTDDAIELAGKEFAVLATLKATGMAEDNQVFMSLAEAQVLLDRPGELTVIEIASDFNLAGEDVLLSQLREALPDANVTGVRQAVMGRDELLASLSRFGLFAGGLILLTGTMVVVLTMSAAVRERTREIGIFRAIGFRGLHIFTIFVTEGLLVSAAGGVIGYHGGLLAARLAGPLLTGSALNSPWQFSVFLVSVAATAVVGCVAGFYPALRAAQLDPAKALRFI